MKTLLLVALAFAGFGFFLYLSFVRLNLFRQFVVGWSLLFLLVLLKRVRGSREPPGRVFFLLLASFITLRYWFWRTFDTLIYTGFFDCIGMVLLYLAEAYGIAVHFLGMFVNIWPLHRSVVPLPEDPEALPVVDVFVPTYNEPEEIVRITVRACLNIDYPREKLRIHILDDGSTVERRNKPETSEMAWERYRRFKRMAEELGVNYIARERNEHAKAGNINNALKYTDGDLILILDCDHVPARDILKNTVGWFLRDEKLFLVQTPHFFINPDPVEKNLATFLDAPSENEMFYRVIQLGLDFWNSSFFCGSAAILRRKYLDEVGGVVGETITEDAETALSLHRKGYNSAYIARPMVCGLSPETYDDFILQRSRWAQGMVQIFILKNPWLAKGLSIYQQLCYINSCIFWFFGLTRFMFFIAPAAYLLFGLKVYNASVPQVMAYAVPHLLSCFVVTDFLYGGARWPFFSELYETVQSIYLIPAVLSAVFNPRAPTFKVTPKGVSLETDFLSPLAAPFYLMFLVVLATFPAAAMRWMLYPMQRDVVVICSVWSLFNLVIMLACLGVVWEKRQLRAFHRVVVKEEVEVDIPGLGLSVPGELRDISLSGVGLVIPDVSLERGDEIVVRARSRYGDVYGLKAELVRSSSREGQLHCGCRFAEEVAFDTLVSFVYGDSERWLDLWRMRSMPISPVRGFFYLVKKGIEGSWYNFKGAVRVFKNKLWRGSRYGEEAVC